MNCNPANSIGINSYGNCLCINNYCGSSCAKKCSSGSSNAVVIALSTVGGVAGLAVILILVYLFVIRPRQKAREDGRQSPRQDGQVDGDSFTEGTRAQGHFPDQFDFNGGNGRGNPVSMATPNPHPTALPQQQQQHQQQHQRGGKAPSVASHNSSHVSTQRQPMTNPYTHSSAAMTTTVTAPQGMSMAPIAHSQQHQQQQAQPHHQQPPRSSQDGLAYEASSSGGQRPSISSQRGPPPIPTRPGDYQPYKQQPASRVVPNAGPMADPNEVSNENATYISANQTEPYHQQFRASPRNVEAPKPQAVGGFNYMAPPPPAQSSSSYYQQ